MDASKLLGKDFWLARAPGFHIADADFLRSAAPLPLSESDHPRLAEPLRDEGYIAGDKASWAIEPAALARVVRQLSADGLSTVFAFLYDEFWLPFRQLHSHLSFLLGGQYFHLPDFWVWNVDPLRGQKGWEPHRDRGHISLFPSGLPKSVTVWIALSEATPLNGCIYVIPAHLDPTYGTPQEKLWKFDMTAVRALPAKPGDFFIWNQAIVHWGGRTSPRGSESRVSMAFEFQRADIAPFNRPLIPPLSVLSFEFRLKLIAKQLLQYAHMYPLDPGTEQMAKELSAVPLVLG